MGLFPGPCRGHACHPEGRCLHPGLVPRSSSKAAAVPPRLPPAPGAPGICRDLGFWFENVNVLRCSISNSPDKALKNPLHGVAAT